MKAIEVALDTAVLIMENGGSTVAANRAFAHVLAGYQKEGVTPVWRLDLVVVKAPEESVPATLFRPIAVPSINLLCASEAMALAERVARGAIRTANFPAALDRVKALPFSSWPLDDRCSRGLRSRRVRRSDGWRPSESRHRRRGGSGGTGVRHTAASSEGSDCARNARVCAVVCVHRQRRSAPWL